MQMPEDKKTTTKQSNFGHDKLSKLLVERLNKQFENPKPSIEPSLVIGLFGEWGSGKSHLLNLIEAYYQEDENRKTLTIPIAFNPWRFEKEEHLIIPLMKTTEFALKKYAEDFDKNHENWFVDNAKTIAKGIADTVDTAAQLCAVSVIAFTRALKTTVGVPGFGSVELTGESFVNEFEKKSKKRKETKNKAEKEAQRNEEIFDELTSIYFNFHQRLKSAIGHDKSGADAPKINLLFLIDDIDRCLPEKAVEMLESIKLFLDIEGCAFVLAVDDEVIERGIEHRYRDYIFQNNQQQNQRKQHTAPPITGAEYLEKIIHLPFRLPLPTKQEVRAFLLGHFGDEVFVEKEGVEDEAFNELGDTSTKKAKKSNHLSKREQNESIKTTLLDLFVNAVPRVPRKLIRAVELFQLLSEIMKERGFGVINEITLARLVIIQLFAPDIYRFGRQRQGFFKTLEVWEADKTVGGGKWLLDTQKDEDFYPQDNDGDKYIYERLGKKLRQLVQESTEVRSGFNIRRLLLEKHPIEGSLSAYFSYLEESSTSVVSLAVQQGKENKPRLILDNESEFIQFITSTRADAWSTVAGYTGIKEGVMSESLYKDFEDALNAQKQLPITQESPFVVPDWLELVVPILPIKSELLDPLTRELKITLEQLDNKKDFDAKKHLNIGDCLAILGDPRKGVGVKNGLPELEWKMVAKGSFKYGESNETKSLDAFTISKYPITNQQFNCFVNADDVENKDWWKDMPEDEYEKLKPSRWSQANRPKTDVSWYQAVAFSRWLAHHLDNKTISLPTEQQWEKAARGQSGKIYPWGDTFEAYKLNSGESGLGETSTVGLYPAGQSDYEVYDMAGNVWEWCLNKYESPANIEVDENGDYRTLRGGSFNGTTDDVRCAFRGWNHPDVRDSSIGFRIVSD